MQDRAGRLLFCTTKNVLLFSNERFAEITLPKQFEGPYELLYQTKDNTTWIAGSNGIASMIWKNNTPEIKYYALPTKINYQVYALCEDDKQNLWIGTFHAGLFKMVKDSIYNMANELGITEEDFFTLKYVKGNLFAATLNGVFVLNTNTNKARYIRWFKFGTRLFT